MSIPRCLGGVAGRPGGNRGLLESISDIIIINLAFTFVELLFYQQSLHFVVFLFNLISICCASCFQGDAVRRLKENKASDFDICQAISELKIAKKALDDKVYLAVLVQLQYSTVIVEH